MWPSGRHVGFVRAGCSACNCDIFQPPGIVTSARFYSSIGSNGSAASASPLAGASV